MSLAAVWAAVLTHLWQTSLVLLALLLTAGLLRRAPARFEHALWTAGLLKLFVPLAAGSVLMQTVAPDAGAYLPPVVASAVWVGVAREVGPFASALEPTLIALTLAWALIAGFLLFRAARDQARAWQLAGAARRPAGKEQDRVRAALRGSAVPTGAILVTDAPIGSAVVGIVRPRILVGESVLDLPAGELRAILEHEDGHRRRLDPARALVRRVAAAVFFFFPPIVPLVRRLHESAECAADEHALRSVRPDTLARSLAQVVRMGLVAAPDPAAAGNAGRRLLARRFERLSTDRRKAMPVHRFAVVAATVLVLGASLLPAASADDPSAEKTAFDTPPAVTHQVPPEYPEPARSDGVEGRVVVGLTVGTDGEPSAVEVVEDVDGYPELGEAAVAAIEQWQFTPAQKDGEAIEAEILVPVEFRLDVEKEEAKDRASEEEASEQAERQKALDEAKQQGGRQKRSEVERE